MKKTIKAKSSLFKYLVVLGVVIVAGYLIVQKMAKTAQVALISDSGKSLTSLLVSFDAVSACSADGFKSYSYTCKDKSVVQIANTVPCPTFSDAYAIAVSNCGYAPDDVRPSFTPQPSTTPTPVPSITPSTKPTSTPKPTIVPTSQPTTRPTTGPTSTPKAIISCATEIYKLPSDVPISDFAKAELQQYKVESGNVTLKKGDNYAVNLALTNLRGSDRYAGSGLKITATTNLGARAPITITPTNWDSCIEDSTNKTMSCTISKLFIQNQKLVRPDAIGLIGLNTVRFPVSATLSYQGVLDTTSFNCSPVTINVEPTYRESCYGWGKLKWCRQTIVQ